MYHHVNDVIYYGILRDYAEVPHKFDQGSIIFLNYFPEHGNHYYFDKNGTYDIDEFYNVSSHP